jgi:hypothetical protein
MEEALGEEARRRSGEDPDALSEAGRYVRKEEPCGDERDEREVQEDVDGALIGACVACPRAGQRMGGRCIRLMMLRVMSRLGGRRPVRR